MAATRADIRRARPLLGTFVEIAAEGAPRDEMEAAVEAAFAAIAHVHARMSFHDPHSDVARLNRDAHARDVRVDACTYQVIETALALHRESHGIFDIAIAPVLQDLGLFPRQVGGAAGAPSAARSGEGIELLEGPCIRFCDPGLRIDLGGIAKGYAVDCAVAVLREARIPRGLVNAGGDLVAFGPPAQLVHLRDPRDPTRLIGSVAVADAALASSARMFDPTSSSVPTLAATIDPRTGAPADRVAGVTVRAPSCMLADALTKVVMILGEEAVPILSSHQADALMISADGDINVTSDWHELLAA
jgi:thiamine biosynthesis lipoprotein